MANPRHPPLPVSFPFRLDNKCLQFPPNTATPRPSHLQTRGELAYSAQALVLKSILLYYNLPQLACDVMPDFNLSNVHRPTLSHVRPRRRPTHAEDTFSAPWLTSPPAREGHKWNNERKRHRWTDVQHQFRLDDQHTD